MSTVLTIDAARLGGRTGRGVRVAVIDSGVHPAHPHIGGIATGVGIAADGTVSDDAVDRLGHGTAVAAAIHEKAPDAAIVPVRVFDRELTATIDALVAAIDWAGDNGAALINLSLGTVNQAHASRLQEAVTRAARRGALVVAAAPETGRAWLPGSLPGVVAVEVDWERARETCELRWADDGRLPRVRASGFPRPIPGVPPERNLRGVSFAVANATGLLACGLDGSISPTSADPGAALRNL